MFVLAGTTRKAIGINEVPGVQTTTAQVAGKLPRQTFRKRIYTGFTKRILDLLCCMLMIPVLLPIMLVIWLLVRRDGGPGLFIQPRIGLNGKIFHCFKFRTMVQDAEKVLEDLCANDPAIAEEWRTYQKLHDDPRISRVGKVLRATSLDELPQIFNVLLGDMSLVGPRPFLPAQKAIYDQAGGRSYYRIRPGVTGPWQVFGRSATTFENRVKFDETYYQKMSLRADLGLLLRTVKVVLCRTGR